MVASKSTFSFRCVTAEDKSATVAPAISRPSPRPLGPWHVTQCFSKKTLPALAPPPNCRRGLWITLVLRRSRFHRCGSPDSSYTDHTDNQAVEVRTSRTYRCLVFRFGHGCSMQPVFGSPVPQRVYLSKGSRRNSLTVGSPSGQRPKRGRNLSSQVIETCSETASQGRPRVYRQ